MLTDSFSLVEFRQGTILAVYKTLSKHSVTSFFIDLEILILFEGVFLLTISIHNYFDHVFQTEPHM